MYLKMHLLHSLMNRSNLLGMGLGVYWAIVLVVGFRVHAGNELGDMEMMKRVGGDSSNGLCTIKGVDPDCSAITECPDCTFAQLGGPCKDDANNNAMSSEGKYPQQCISPGGDGPYCNTGNLQDIWCNAYWTCDCQWDGEDPTCITSPATDYCINNFDVGSGFSCTYENCPP